MGRLLGYISSKLHHTRQIELVFLAVVLVLIGAVLLGRNVFADSNTNSGNHIITIYDNGSEKTIVSQASTVDEALRDADIRLSNYDSINPDVNSKIVSGSNVITIRRARPIVVRDGSREIRIITAAQSNAEVAADAKVKIYAEDRVSVTLVDDMLAAGGAGLVMNIERAKVVNLRLYGQEMKVRTQSQTIADFLDEKHIRLGSEDGMNLDLDTRITDEMSLHIWRNGIQTVTANESIPYDTKTIRDPNLKVGYREVQTQGQDGQKTVIYQIEMRDNQEINRTKISEVVNVEAVQQVEVVGTKVSLPPGSHADWMTAAGISTSDHGYVNYIFSHESGWRPNAKNPSGKYVGLGQTSPSALSGACPNWESDPICQIVFFDGYAKRRYGSWEKAYNFWIQRSWW